jgi:dipeptide/tripeptide permease
VFKAFTLEKGICFGLAILILGLGLLLHGVWVWQRTGYGLLSYGDNMRRLLPAVTLVVVSIQIVFSSFFMSVLGLKTGTRHPPNT